MWNIENQQGDGNGDIMIAIKKVIFGSFLIANGFLFYYSMLALIQFPPVYALFILQFFQFISIAIHHILWHNDKELKP